MVDAGEGFEGREGELALSGWQSARHVIVMRRRLEGEVVLSEERTNSRSASSKAMSHTALRVFRARHHPPARDPSAGANSIAIAPTARTPSMN